MESDEWKIISAYTRAEAIADGTQVPVNRDLSRECGIVFPVFITQMVFDKYVNVPKGMEWQDETGRLWDILYMFSRKAKVCEGASLEFQFVCQLPDKGNWTENEKICEGNRTMREVTLMAEIGPMDIDDASPAITIMFPGED